MTAPAYIAQAPLPEEALEKHRGKWVAIRAGKVIAAADEFDELVADEQVKQTDALYRIPPSSTHFY